MDNKAYLDEIAVKGKRQGVGAGILSPMLIKLIIVALFAVIALAVVGNIISALLLLPIKKAHLALTKTI